MARKCPLRKLQSAFDKAHRKAAKWHAAGRHTHSVSKNKVRIGGDCSGLETLALAAERTIRAEIVHEFSSELNPQLRSLMERTYSVHQVYTDLTQRRHSKAASVDIYGAGFPCQPWSTQGSKKGIDDERAWVIPHIIEYIAIHRPAIVLLENVKNILSRKHRPYFDAVIQALERAGGPAGTDVYQVHYAVLNSKDYGCAQYRQRVWIVCLLLDKLTELFRWPQTQSTVLADEVLDAECDTDDIGNLSAPKQAKLDQAMAEITRRHGDPMDTWLIDISSSPKFGENMRLNCCPCITRSRGGSGGFYISNRWRMTRIHELARLQGFEPSMFNLANISHRQFGLALGNAWSLPVAEAVLRSAAISVGMQVK